MSADRKRDLVVVTGGAGYIGSSLCPLLLRQGYRVRVIDSLLYGRDTVLKLVTHSRFELVEGDVRDRKKVRECLRGAHAVVHLAALVGDKLCDKNRATAIAINYDATRDLVSSCLREGVKRFVFSSTSSNYGVMDTSRPATEESVLNPVSLYAETKVDCEKHILEVKEKGFSPVIFRFASGFGVSGRIRFDLTVNSFSYEAWRDNEIIVFAANTWRPYIHVHDMARVLRLGVAAPDAKVKKQVFNAGADIMNYMKSDIALMLKDNVPGLKVSSIEKKDNRTYRLDFSKIRKTLKFRPTRSIADGIQGLLETFRAGLVSNEYFLDNSLERIKIIK